MGKYELVEKAIYNFFYQNKQQNVPIGGLIIRVKALKSTKELNILNVELQVGSKCILQVFFPSTS